MHKQREMDLPCLRFGLIGRMQMSSILACLLGFAINADDFATAKISGTVTDAAGKPIAGATVLVNRTTDSKIFGGLPQTTTDEKGHYELTIKFGKAKPIAVRDVWASAKGFIRVTKDPELCLKDGESA